MEQCGTEGDDNDVMCIIIMVPIKGVCEVHCASKSSENIGKLTHCRVSQDLLQIHLDEGYCCSHNSGNSTNCCNNKGKVVQVTVQCLCTKEREHASNKIQSSVDHGRSVNEGRYWSRAFHSVRQPNVKRELCRLTNSSNEHQS